MMTYGGNMMGYGLFNNGWSWFIGIGLVLIAIVVVYLFISNNHRDTSGEEAMDILKIKFAQGDITIEEYHQRKNVLKGK